MALEVALFTLLAESVLPNGVVEGLRPLVKCCLFSFKFGLCVPHLVEQDEGDVVFGWVDAAGRALFAGLWQV